jgi:flagellar hook-length control protein FliK
VQAQQAAANGGAQTDADAAAAASSTTATTAAATSATDGTGSGDPKSVRDALQAALSALKNGEGGAGYGKLHDAGTSDTASSATSGFASRMAARTSAKGAGDNFSATDGRQSADNGAGKTGNTHAASAGDAGKHAADAAVATATAAASADAGAQANGANGTATSNAADAANAANAANAALAATSAAASAAAQAQAVQTPNAAAAAGANAAALAPQVGTSDWEDALSQKVVFLSNAHQQTAELTLNPKDLGPLQVVLQVADNHAHALFVSQHQQVREAVEAALPKLREAMEAGGIGLGSASVSDGFARQMNQQAQQDSRGYGSGSGPGSSTGSGDAGTGDSVDAATSASATRRTVGLVDTFA